MTMSYRILTTLVACLILVGCSEQTTNFKTKPAVTEAYINDVFLEEKIEARILEVSQQQQVGGEYLSKTASQGAVLLIVVWEYKNITDKPIGMFQKIDLKLVDTTGNVYNPDVDATTTFIAASSELLKINEKVISDLNPGITVRGAKVFEVAKARFSDEWKLKVGKTYISLKSDQNGKRLNASPQQSLDETGQQKNPISIESSDLHSDPSKKAGSVTLTVNLHNSASVTQPYPSLALTLFDAQDQPLARQLFEPDEYVKQNFNSSKNIGSGQKTEIKLRLESNEFKATGYRLILIHNNHLQ